MPQTLHGPHLLITLKREDIIIEVVISQTVLMVLLICAVTSLTQPSHLSKAHLAMNCCLGRASACSCTSLPSAAAMAPSTPSQASGRQQVQQVQQQLHWVMHLPVRISSRKPATRNLWHKQQKQGKCGQGETRVSVRVMANLLNLWSLVNCVVEVAGPRHVQ